MTMIVVPAYFSRTDGCRLLVTDQLHDLVVYKAPAWTKETTIYHPHRIFRHLTPIKVRSKERKLYLQEKMSRKKKKKKILVSQTRDP